LYYHPHKCVEISSYLPKLKRGKMPKASLLFRGKIESKLRNKIPFKNYEKGEEKHLKNSIVTYSTI
jgi:hypothetical protein